MLAFTLMLSAAASRAAYANTIKVDTGADGIDFIHCTIRRAIENHNAKGQPNKQCGAGSGTDVIYVPQTMNLGDPLPAISGTLTIERNSVVCGNLRQAAYMTVNPGANVTLWGVGIQANGSHNSSVIDNNGGNLTIKAVASADICRFSNEHTGNLPGTGGILFNRNNGKVAISGTNFVFSHARSAGGAIYIDSGTVTITDSLTDFPSNFVDDNADQGGAIFVNRSATLNIASNNFSFSRNQAGSTGGAIYNAGGNVTIQRGSSTLSNVSIANNRASSGAGIFSSGGQLNIDGIQINNNSSTGSGGGVVVSNQPAKISRTYFHNNSANVQGGAIYATQRSALTVSASTFQLDRATQQGGGIYVDVLGDLKVINSTFVGGVSREGVVLASGGAEIVNSTLVTANLGSQPVTLSNSILRDVICTNVQDDGLNLQFQSSGCPGSIPTTDPNLSPILLANNGGPTPTIALLNSSPAIDAIPLPDCIDQEGNPIKTDQRGFGRPAGPKCDIGAFEYGATP
jgi:predicted outer membrane repeat protein